MNVFEDMFRTHPTIWQGVKLCVTAILTIIAVTVLLRLEKILSKRLIQKRNNINLRFVENILRFVVIFLAMEWVVMSSPLTQPFGRVLFQGTTVIAAIAGFAAQPVIADLICGLMLSATRPFDIGDRIELEDGTSGIVRDITLRHVRLQDIDGITIILPNSRLNAMKVINMSYHTPLLSVHMRFSVAYDTDVQKAMQVIARAVEQSPLTTPGKPVGDQKQYGPVYFLEYAESSLVLGTTVYFEPVNATEAVRSDINARILRAFTENGIEIPYNYLNVVVKEGKEQP